MRLTGESARAAAQTAVNYGTRAGAYVATLINNHRVASGAVAAVALSYVVAQRCFGENPYVQTVNATVSRNFSSAVTWVRESRVAKLLQRKEVKICVRETNPTAKATHESAVRAFAASFGRSVKFVDEAAAKVIFVVTKEGDNAEEIKGSDTKVRTIDGSKIHQVDGRWAARRVVDGVAWAFSGGLYNNGSSVSFDYNKALADVADVFGGKKEVANQK